MKNLLAQLKWQNIAMLILAGIINAVGVTFFIAPVNLYDSGVSGTAILLSQVTGGSLALFILLLNVPLFLYGLKKQGAVFTAYSLIAVAFYSLGAFIINDVLPVDVSVASPLAGRDLLLCALFGGLISGTGSGLTIRFGGAIDGVDVLAVIFAKRLGITVGTFDMVYNVILYVICGAVLNSWILPLYSIVTYWAALRTIDYIVEGFDRAKAATIVTTMPEEVCSALSEAFGTGLTVMDAKGYYSSSCRTVVYFVLNRFQIGRMRGMVHDIDPSAFIAISEVADVFGSQL